MNLFQVSCKGVSNGKSNSRLENHCIWDHTVLKGRRICLYNQIFQDHLDRSDMALSYNSDKLGWMSVGKRCESWNVIATRAVWCRSLTGAGSIMIMIVIYEEVHPSNLTCWCKLKVRLKSDGNSNGKPIKGKHVSLRIGNLQHSWTGRWKEMIRKEICARYAGEYR